MSFKEIDDIFCAVLLNPLTDAVPEYWDEKLDEEDRERLEDQGFIEWKRQFQRKISGTKGTD